MSRRSAVALLVIVVAFGAAFAIARAVAGGAEEPAAEPVRETPAASVPVQNLERAPTIKPLRSLAGSPPASAGPATSTPAP